MTSTNWYLCRKSKLCWQSGWKMFFFFLIYQYSTSTQASHRQSTKRQQPYTQVPCCLILHHVMCQPHLSQQKCRAFNANKLWRDYKSLNYPMHPVWIMQDSAYNHVSTLCMRYLTKLLNTAQGSRVLVCISGLNSLVMCLHMWLHICKCCHWLWHVVHTKCSHWRRNVAVDMFTLWHLSLVHQAWEGRGPWKHLLVREELSAVRQKTCINMAHAHRHMQILTQQLLPSHVWNIIMLPEQWIICFAMMDMR